MKTTQPAWHCVANIGDVNPLEYGGGFVLVDKFGVYTPELWIYTPSVSGEEPGAWSNVSLERCQPIRDTYQVSDNRYHPTAQAWFDAVSVAECSDISALEMSEALCSSNVVERAIAYERLVDFYGIDNFGGEEKSSSLNLDRRRIKQLERMITETEAWAKDSTKLCANI
jgi:hypothetical protein